MKLDQNRIITARTLFMLDNPKRHTIQMPQIGFTYGAYK
jgi:hypothetical protein